MSKIIFEKTGLSYGQKDHQAISLVFKDISRSYNILKPQLVRIGVVTRIQAFNAPTEGKIFEAIFRFQVKRRTIEKKINFYFSVIFASVDKIFILGVRL